MPEPSAQAASRPRTHRGRLACLILLGIGGMAAVRANPHVPARDDEVLARLPPGAAHSSLPIRQQGGARLDVALPLAQFYISQARATGDLRFLGYAEAVLLRWRGETPPNPDVLVLHATILQSRHSFDAALGELNEALRARPDDAQAWLTRATVLRVLGRYDEAGASCVRLAAADVILAQLCTQSLRALDGHLESAYTAVRQLPLQSLSNAARAWRYSELGEMAQSLGDDSAAAHWFLEALQLAPDDAYTRAAYADLLLGEGRAAETLRLLDGRESMEPMLLRIALAQQQLNDPGLTQSRQMLASAFAVEEQRGEAVHRREQARFLLDVAQLPSAALSAAQDDWRVQREPADLLMLLRAAYAAHQPAAAAPALQFVREHGTEDVRFAPYLGRSQ
jgi:tetratricopeptide (TPR) repeat protein